jgi:hypothetical protein
MLTFVAWPLRVRYSMLQILSATSRNDRVTPRCIHGVLVSNRGPQTDVPLGKYWAGRDHNICRDSFNVSDNSPFVYLSNIQRYIPSVPFCLAALNTMHSGHVRVEDLYGLVYGP